MGHKSPKPEHLRAKLVAVRKHLELSQTQMVERLGLNIEYGRLSEYERGKRFPPIYVLLAYARAGKIHIDDLVDDEIELKF
jgi:transcriptional regulator with XRE-family HTH domain